MKRAAAVLVALVLAAVTFVATPAAAAAPYCGIRWGSLAKSASGMSTATLVNVRAGRHTCYDRVVLDVAGAASGYSIEYVAQVREDGSGAVIPVRGGARLQVTAHVPAYTESGQSTYTPANPTELVNVAGFRTLRQLVWAGTFEGYSSIGIGVRARLPFRVFTLSGPGPSSRIVIDIAHRW